MIGRNDRQDAMMEKDKQEMKEKRMDRQGEIERKDWQEANMEKDKQEVKWKG